MQGNAFCTINLKGQHCERLLQALSGGLAPSSVFGGEHMLRLFVRLPQLLPMATLPPTAAEVLEAHLKQFIAWMASHQKELFLPLTAYR